MKLLVETNNKLEYSIVGYSTQIGNDSFGDTEVDLTHNKLESYDGNPIYGPHMVMTRLMIIHLSEY